MSPPILNITFCGTNSEATRDNSASLRAIRQFEDHLIIAMPPSNQFTKDKKEKVLGEFSSSILDFYV
jgi:hypothetical protein